MAVNIELLNRVADYLDARPGSYKFGWRGCIGGRAIRMTDGRFIDLGGAVGVRPVRDDPPEQVRTDRGVRYVEPFDRAVRVCGLTPMQGTEVFINAPMDGDGHLAAAHVRRFLAGLEAS
jgi:hypothetical protein